MNTRMGVFKVFTARYFGSWIKQLNQTKPNQHYKLLNTSLMQKRFLVKTPNEVVQLLESLLRIRGRLTSNNGQQTDYRDNISMILLSPSSRIP